MNNKYTYIIGKGGGSSEGSLRYDQPQQLTAEQQKQAQENLGIDLSANLKREIVEALPATGEANIIYMVKRAETKEDNVYDEYMYIDSQWDKIGSTDVDLSGYYTKEEADDKFLTEHQEIKTINGESIIGTGNVEIKGFSGDYNDLINKPTILNHWFGTQEEYDKIEVKDPNTIYHVEGGGEGGIKTIEVDNIYVPETDFWPHYRIHQDVLIPLLQSGEEFQLKEYYKTDWDEGYRYYRLPAYRKQNVEKGGFADVEFLQYPGNVRGGGVVATIRYYGEPDEEGYYRADKQEETIVNKETPFNVSDDSYLFEDNDTLYNLIRRYKAYLDDYMDGEYTSSVVLIEKTEGSTKNAQYLPTDVQTDNNRWSWDIPEGEESTAYMFAVGNNNDGEQVTLKLTAHRTTEGSWENKKEYIEGGGENVGRKTFYLDILNTTSYEAKMQAAEIAQYAIQNQTTDFVVIGLNNKDNTLTSTEIATNGVNELTINFQWGNGREYITLTANSPTDIDIRRDGVTYATLQDLEDINNILERI